MEAEEKEVKMFFMVELSKKGILLSDCELRELITVSKAYANQSKSEEVERLREALQQCDKLAGEILVTNQEFIDQVEHQNSSKIRGIAHQALQETKVSEREG